MAPYPTQKVFTAGTEFPPTTPGRLRIYSMRFCPYAQRTRLVLAHKNIDFETVNIHLKNKPSWFLTKNPLGLVPVLELDDKIVYESTATSDWLDDVYPQNKLTPSDPYRKARDRILMEYASRLGSAYYSLFRSAGDKEKNVEDLHKVFRFYEDALAERDTKLFGGDQPAMIDFHIWPHMERIPGFLSTWVPECAITKEKYPHLSDWFTAMYELPAVKATMFDTETHQYYAKTSAAGQSDYDYNL